MNVSIDNIQWSPSLSTSTISSGNIIFYILNNSGNMGRIEYLEEGSDSEQWKND